MGASFSVSVSFDWGWGCERWPLDRRDSRWSSCELVEELRECRVCECRSPVWSSLLSETAEMRDGLRVWPWVLMLSSLWCWRWPCSLGCWYTCTEGMVLMLAIVFLIP